MVVPPVIANTLTETAQTPNKRASVENTSSVLEAAVVGGGTEGTQALTIREKTQIPPLPPVYVSPRKENKRTKTVKDDQEPDSSDSVMNQGNDDTTQPKNRSATSGREDRREQ